MDKKKHILFISSWYPNKNDPTLGIFNRFFADAAALYNTVSVLHVSSDEQAGSGMECVEVMQNGILTVTVYYRKITSSIPFLSAFMKRKKVLQAFDLGYQKLVDKVGKPDIIQLNVIMPMGVGAYHLSEKHGIPYVINENWSGYCEEDGNYKGFVQKYYTRRIVNKAKAIMPTSTYLRDAMLSHGLAGNYEVVPNVVNIHLFRPMQNTQDKSVTRLIHISSLNDREKNVSGILRAFEIAARTSPQLELNIVGEGVDRPEYQRLVREMKLENKIKFKGRLFGEDLVKEINANDALIMFSHFETFCLVIVETFACGKPVITSDAGAIKTYMKPELGIMVPKRDEQALAEAILRFVKERATFDSTFIRNFAVENYSYEKVGRQLNRIYSAALSNKLE